MKKGVWHAQTAKVAAFWMKRTRRERGLLLALMALLLVGALWRGIWLPWSGWRAAARLTVAAEQTRADEWAAIEAEMTRLAPLALVPRPDAAFVEAELHRRAEPFQVDLSSCLVAQNGREIECRGEAAFDQWVRLLAALQRPPVLHATEWSAEPAGASGRVRLFMRLTGAGS
jgi:type II secretory pathway component PulM